MSSTYRFAGFDGLHLRQPVAMDLTVFGQQAQLDPPTANTFRATGHTLLTEAEWQTLGIADGECAIYQQTAKSGSPSQAFVSRHNALVDLLESVQSAAAAQLAAAMAALTEQFWARVGVPQNANSNSANPPRLTYVPPPIAAAPRPVTIPPVVVPSPQGKG